jgi:acetylornithine deacetylase/succinyl-diaminopimelate desuccinylase-like protein
VVNRDRIFHSMLRTTCVATLLEGGHANNALPQHAEANVNCRIFPGNTIDATQAALEQAIGNPQVKELVKTYANALGGASAEWGQLQLGSRLVKNS